MGQNLPFVRIHYVKHASEFNISGGLFYLHTANNHSEIAVVSLTNGTSQILYQVWPGFLTKYSEILPVGDIHNWDHKEGLSAWLDLIIYHSFLHSSEQGVERCWFVNNVPSPNAYALTGVPLGFEHFFTQEANSFWILLTNGTRVWPVNVINNNFRDHWATFLKDHAVKPQYKIVFGCCRRWMFDIIILNANLERVMQSWNTEDNNMQNLYISSHVTLTSCLPSTMRTDFYHMQFGCVFTSRCHFAKVFEHNLDPILRDGELDHAFFNIGNRRWKVPIWNGKIGSWSLNKFIDDHGLAPNDFLLVGVSGRGHLHALIFARHGGERIYEWF